MAKNNKQSYFDIFIELVDFSCSAAKNLHKTLSDFDADKLPETMEYLHEIEHAADQRKHDMMTALAREFITPIEREDIITLAQEIDDVTDSIEDVLLKIYMFNIRSIKEEALAFTDIIVECCEALKKVMEDFHNFKKASSRLKEGIIAINGMEEKGDDLYMKAMRNLYTSGAGPVEIMSWTATFNKLESCCDNCEDVADVVESVIMKNT